MGAGPRNGPVSKTHLASGAGEPTGVRYNTADSAIRLRSFCDGFRLLQRQPNERLPLD
jgi:hypothetical protein